MTKWAPVRQLIEGFNQRRVEKLYPGWRLCLDESVQPIRTAHGTGQEGLSVSADSTFECLENCVHFRGLVKTDTQFDVAIDEVEFQNEVMTSHLHPVMWKAITP